MYVFSVNVLSQFITKVIGNDSNRFDVTDERRDY